MFSFIIARHGARLSSTWSTPQVTHTVTSLSKNKAKNKGNYIHFVSILMKNVSEDFASINADNTDYRTLIWKTFQNVHLNSFEHC